MSEIQKDTIYWQCRSARVCSKPRASLTVKHGSVLTVPSSVAMVTILCCVSCRRRRPLQVHGSAPGDGFLQSQVQLRIAIRGIHRRPGLNRDPDSAVPGATTRMSSFPQQPPNRLLLSTYRFSCPSLFVIMTVSTQMLICMLCLHI